MKQIKTIIIGLLSLAVTIFFLYLTVSQLRLTSSTYTTTGTTESFSFFAQFAITALVCFIISLLSVTITIVSAKMFIKTYNDNSKRDRDIYIKDTLENISYQRVINFINSNASLEDKKAKVAEFYRGKENIITINPEFSDFLTETLNKIKENRETTKTTTEGNLHKEYDDQFQVDLENQDLTDKEWIRKHSKV